VTTKSISIKHMVV